MKLLNVRTLIFTNLFLEILMIGMFLYGKHWIFLIVLCVFMLLYHIKRFNRFLYTEFEFFIVLGTTKIDLDSGRSKYVPYELSWLFHAITFIVLLTLTIAILWGLYCGQTLEITFPHAI